MGYSHWPMCTVPLRGRGRLRPSWRRWRSQGVFRIKCGQFQLLIAEAASRHKSFAHSGSIFLSA